MKSYDNTFKRVHVSSKLAPRPRRVGESYGLSTRCHRVSPGQLINILRGVLVSVVSCTTLLAGPVPVGQLQGLVDPSTVGTPFRGREVPANYREVALSPHALIRQHPSKLTEGRVGDILRQPSVTYHTLDVEILDSDLVILPDQISRYFLEVIAAGVGNLGVDLRYLDSLSLVTTTAYDSTGEDPLFPSKFLLVLPKISGVRDPCPVGQRRETINTEIHTNGLSCVGIRRDFLVENKSNEVPTGRVLGYRDRSRGTFETPGPTYSESPEFRDGEVPVERIPLERRRSKFGGLFASLGLECRIPRMINPFLTVLEESPERGVEMSQRLLERDTRNLIEPYELGISFKGSEIRRGLDVADGSSVMPRVSTKSQPPVIHEACMPENLSEVLGLFLSRVEPEFVSHLHKDHITTVNRNCQQEIVSSSHG